MNSTTIDDFANWFDQVGLDKDNIDDIFVLFDDIGQGSSEENADFVVSQKDSTLHITPSDSELPTFEYDAARKVELVRWLDGLYSEEGHGGVIGEHEYRKCIERND